jgi:drug/metabolite transporter (DMT)-like permease
VNKSVFYALAAAVFFGASTPLAKVLVSEVSPLLLAGLLYLGSGIGLCVFRLIRDKGWKSSGIKASEWPWFFAAIFFGGVLGPVALMYGLITTSGSTTSLMLNLESVLTAALAWGVFKENADKRIVLGMVAIVAGGIVLSWQPHDEGGGSSLGLAAIAVACLCWAIDNNLTRKVSAYDAVFTAGIKGLLSGLVNCAIAFIIGDHLTDILTVLITMVVGLTGYGVSLVLFVLALRGLGAARTGAYFSIAPFIGSAVALIFFGEAASTSFWVASTLMGLGVWLHLTEHHEHEHCHEAVEHTHTHSHDLHHQHQHELGIAFGESHAHWHRHEPVKHKHPHFPDIHHQHLHD